MSMKFRNLRNFVIFTLKRKISNLENPLSLRRSYRSVKYFQQRSWLKDCLNLFQNIHWPERQLANFPQRWRNIYWQTKIRICRSTCVTFLDVKKKCSAESFKFLTQPKLHIALNKGSIIEWPLALGSYVMNSSQIFSRTALPIGQ